jgi:hypothetical protein
MNVAQRAQQTKLVLGTLARSPGEARRLPRFLSTIGHSTLELRQPWLPYGLIELLDQRLDASSRVLEYGGGGSTAFFADRVGEVISVEHDEGWHGAISEAMAGVPNVHVLLRTDADDFAGYVGAVEEQDDDSLDVVLVDGRRRVRCAAAARTKVKPGGLLILDDADRPKYAEAHELLAGWPSETFSGLVPTKDHAGLATVWTRPA